MGEAAEYDGARRERPAFERVTQRDRVPGGWLDDLVLGIPRIIDRCSHEPGRELGVDLNEIGADAVPGAPAEHFLAEAIAADATHHADREPGGPQMAGSIERRAAEEQARGQRVPEDLTDAQDFRICHDTSKVSDTTKHVLDSDSRRPLIQDVSNPDSE